MAYGQQAAIPGGVIPTVRRPEARLGELLEAAALVGSLKGAEQRGMRMPYRDRITVSTGSGEAYFELVRVAQDVRWQRTR